MARKRAVAPRPHGRPAIKQNDDPGVQKRQVEAVVKFDRAFCSNLPSHEASGQQNMASRGSYVQVEGDAFHNEKYPVADGRYRVNGSEWIHTFQGGGYVETERAEPPEYGGKGVIAVDVPMPG